MAHYLAELITEAETASGDERPAQTGEMLRGNSELVEASL